MIERLEELCLQIIFVYACRIDFAKPFQILEWIRVVQAALEMLLKEIIGHLRGYIELEKRIYY